MQFRIEHSGVLHHTVIGNLVPKAQGSTADGRAAIPEHEVQTTQHDPTTSDNNLTTLQHSFPSERYAKRVFNSNLIRNTSIPRKVRPTSVAPLAIIAGPTLHKLLRLRLTTSKQGARQLLSDYDYLAWR